MCRFVSWCWANAEAGLNPVACLQGSAKEHCTVFISEQHWNSISKFHFDIMYRRLKKGTIRVADLNPITLGMCTLMELSSWHSLTDVPLLGSQLASTHNQLLYFFKSDRLPPFSGGLVVSDYLKRAPGVSILVKSRKSCKDSTRIITVGGFDFNLE